ncbi:MAG: glycosyltransferase [Clostridium sp.]|nr:glycosyltransferase [Roseburia sp.]MCM1432125.1 glycosyltransferase [Muribaculaceae bacterium]MCM1499507.1 glycosyltransferase [Clostridium sp.]
MKKVKISIVIPVYNTPMEALYRCIHSILEQKYPYFEVIIVDDGSNIECYEYLTRLSLLDERILLYRKENGGVSSARNYGIDKANGDYIAFVDADDTIADSFFVNAIGILEDEVFDVIIGNIAYVDEAGENLDQLNRKCIVRKTILQGSSILHLKKALMFIPDEKYTDMVTALNSPCAKLYRISIVKKHLFNTCVSFGEDALFNREVFNDCRSAVIIPETWYIYYQNSYSAMHRHKAEKYIEGCKKFFEEWHKMNLVETEIDIKEHTYYYTVVSFYDVCHGLLMSSVDKKYFKKTIISFLEEPVFTTLFDSVKTKNISGRMNKIKFLLMKYRLTGFIYIYYKRKYFSGNI